MDNNLSSMLYALNTYRQGTKIDKDSLLNGKIVVYSNANPDANAALVAATGDLVSAYPNPNAYEILDVYFSGGDGSQGFAYIIIRVN
jgi:hypothetical protein